MSIQPSHYCVDDVHPSQQEESHHRSGTVQSVEKSRVLDELLPQFAHALPSVFGTLLLVLLLGFPVVGGEEGCSSTREEARKRRQLRPDPPDESVHLAEKHERQKRTHHGVRRVDDHGERNHHQSPANDGEQRRRLRRRSREDLESHDRHSDEGEHDDVRQDESVVFDAQLPDVAHQRATEQLRESHRVGDRHRADRRVAGLQTSHDDDDDEQQSRDGRQRRCCDVVERLRLAESGISTRKQTY